MKSKFFLASAALALALSVAAQAAVTTSIGDLVLGFAKTSGTGSGNNIEVNLGSITDFKSGGTFATGSEVSLSRLAVADLDSIYGTGTGSAGWKTTVLQWGVAGTNAIAGAFGADNTSWVTRTSLPTVSANQGTGANNIKAVYNGLNAATTAGSNAYTASILTGNANSWTTKSSSGFSQSNWGSQMFTNTNALATLGGVVSLNLYESVVGGPNTLLGTFKLYDTGAFTFTAFTAIPEPSTYAALLGVVTLGVVAIRRRRQAALEAAI